MNSQRKKYGMAGGVSEFLSYLNYQVFELISRLASIKTKGSRAGIRVNATKNKQIILLL